MKQTIDTTSQFAGAFKAAGRENQFSRDGLDALFNYLEESDPGYELDVIELCCEREEYSEAADGACLYGWQREDDLSEEDNEASALAFLQERTTVIEFDGGVLIAQF